MEVLEKIDSKKIKFIEDFLHIDDEKIINKLSNLLYEETINLKRQQLNLLTINELDERLHQSNDDILNNRVKKQEEFIDFIKNRQRG